MQTIEIIEWDGRPVNPPAIGFYDLDTGVVYTALHGKVKSPASARYRQIFTKPTL